jgi:hypothetical protein
MNKGDKVSYTVTKTKDEVQGTIVKIYLQDDKEYAKIKVGNKYKFKQTKVLTLCN